MSRTIGMFAEAKGILQGAFGVATKAKEALIKYVNEKGSLANVEGPVFLIFSGTSSEKGDEGACTQFEKSLSEALTPHFEEWCSKLEQAGYSINAQAYLAGWENSLKGIVSNGHIPAYLMDVHAIEIQDDSGTGVKAEVKKLPTPTFAGLTN